MKRLCFLLAFMTALTAADFSFAEDSVQAPDYANQVAPIFRKYCNGCHNAEDAEGKLVLDDFGKLMRGGKGGAVVVPGDPAKSRLILSVEKKAKPFMPPEDNEEPAAAEIALLKAWVAAGAKGPDGKGPDPTLLVTPKIAPAGDVRRPIGSLAVSPNGELLAVARYGTVEILSTKDQKLIHKLEGHAGNVNDVGFSADGALLFAAAGEAGLFGEVTLWKTADWQRAQTIRGHRDSLYAAALSPDGTVLATGGWDQAIKLWETADGKELRELTGHNGPVFDIAFHPNGKLLASASGDRTVKLWNVATGERLDTLSQPEKDQYTVAFSPDGRHVAAGGVDNRIRVWRIERGGREGTNPLLYARFAHEAAILRLAFSPDGRTLVSTAEDRTIKHWETEAFTQRSVLEGQPDWASALAIAPDNGTLIIGRLDGSLGSYPLNTGDQRAETATPIINPPVPVPHAELPKETKLPEIAEAEPNDAPANATAMPAPGTANGVFLPRGDATQDVDLFRFESKAGQTWIVETSAARRKSPADTKIEILTADGEPVLRYRLQAVRDSYITFRPIDSTQDQVRVKNWEEMDLNQYLYMGGEICKIFRMPQGPDSGFQFYAINGKRRCYFDTSATVHANEDPIYVVEAYAAGAPLVDNGLPVFPLYYVNDDDGNRALGSDSRLTFTAPADGAYLVRVTDVRDFSGKEHIYSLTVREPKPDFRVTLGGTNATIPAGSGQRLSVKLDRLDDFDGDVRIDIAGLPAGFSVTSPIVVQAGHLEARGVINAAADAQAPPKEEWANVKVTATATLHGKEIVKEVGNLGELKLAERPKVLVTLEPDAPAGLADGSATPNELVIAPGSTVTAMIRIERNGFEGELKFDVENLPHGVIVDNLGLNGIMVRKGESERQIFLTAAAWVPETTHHIHAIALSEGNQASRPVALRVRAAGKVAAAER